MDAVDYQTYGEERIQIKLSGGVLSSLGLKMKYLNAYLCPDCRLVHFYAD